jgi:hypothetical protein
MAPRRKKTATGTRRSRTAKKTDTPDATRTWNGGVTERRPGTEVWAVTHDPDESGDGDLPPRRGSG